MITDEAIERLLSEAADLYQPPVDGPERIVAAASPVRVAKPRRQRSWRQHRAALMSAAAAIVLVTAAIASAMSGGSNPQTAMKAAPARLSAPQPNSAPTQFANDVGGTSDGTSAGAMSASGTRGVAVQHPAPGKAPSRSQPQSSALPKVGTGDTARVVKTGSADLEVSKQDVVLALSKLGSIADKYGGYVLSSQTDESGDSPTGSVSLRIPEPRYDQAVNDVRRLGTIDSLSTQASDVTSQYTDLQARLHALQSTHDQFVTLLSRANTIGDVLAVQSQITNVQQQIDQTQGQLKLLASQSSYGTFNVTVHAKGAPAVIFPTHHKSGLHRAWNDSVNGFLGGVEFILAGIGPALVFLLAVIAAFFVGRFAYGAVRRRLV